MSSDTMEQLNDIESIQDFPVWLWVSFALFAFSLALLCLGCVMMYWFISYRYCPKVKRRPKKKSLFRSRLRARERGPRIKKETPVMSEDKSLAEVDFISSRPGTPEQFLHNWGVLKAAMRPVSPSASPRSKNDLSMLRHQMAFVRAQYQPDASSISESMVVECEVEHSNRNQFVPSPFPSLDASASPVSCIKVETIDLESSSSESVCEIPLADVVHRRLELALRAQGSEAIVDLGDAIEEALQSKILSYEDDVIKEAMGVLRGLMAQVPNPDVYVDVDGI